MKVVVEFTAGARENLLQLVAGRTRDEGDVPKFVTLLVEDLTEQFREYEGAPPEAGLLPEPRGDEWWWHYAADIWIGFMVAD